MRRNIRSIRLRPFLSLLLRLPFAALVFGWIGLLLGASSESQPSLRREASVITISGSINAASAEYIRTEIDEATRQRKALLLLEIDTPGGFLQATRDIVKTLLNAEIPIVVFVTPAGARAGSAGVFITMAGHLAAMSPGTNIGAAHPVTSGGKDPEASGGKHMAKKIENDTVAFIEAIAKQRGRNVKWARSAVLESDSVTSDEALRLKVIDVVASDIPDLLKKIHGRTIEIQKKSLTLHTRDLRIDRRPMNFKQRFINFFADPNIAYLLLTFGMLGLAMELRIPGAIFPGVVGAICLFLAFVAMQVLPINYGGLALIGLGVLLLIAEMFTPTFGVLFLGGLVSLFFGSIFFIDSPNPALTVSLHVILPTLGFLALLFGFVLLAVLRLHKTPSITGVEAMIGSLAQIRNPLTPQGTVFAEGTLWTAIADSPETSTLSIGQMVEITQVQGLTLRVRLPSAASTKPSA